MPRKREFIENSIAGFPIPGIYVATRDESEDELIIIDGKQRLSTINEFMDEKNGFYIFMYNKETGKKEKVYYRDLKKNKQAGIVLDIKLTLVKFHNPPLDVMVAIFQSVNKQVSLTQDEKIYGEHFLSGALFDYLFDTTMVQTGLSQHMNAVGSKSKNKHVLFVHKTMSMIAGDEMNDKEFLTIIARKTSSDVLRQNASKLENKIRELVKDTLDITPTTKFLCAEKHIKSLGMAPVSNVLKKVASALTDCYNVNPAELATLQKTNHPNDNITRDILAVFAILHDEGELTADTIKAFKTEIYNGVIKPYITELTNYLKGCSTRDSHVSLRIGFLAYHIKNFTDKVGIAPSVRLATFRAAKDKLDYENGIITTTTEQKAQLKAAA
jgi:hypothetical protein